MLSKYQNITLLNNLKNNSAWSLFAFSEVLSDSTRMAKKIKKGEYLKEGLYPIVDQSKEFVAGYTNKKEKLYDKPPIIIFGDHTRIIKYIDFPSFIGADGVKLLKNNMGEEKLSTKYLYYYLRTIEIPDTGYNRHFKYLKDVVFPIPDLNMQKQIVDILDQTQSIINKRKQQIEALDQLAQSVFFDMFGDPVLNNLKWPIQSFDYFARIDTKMIKDFTNHQNKPHIGIDSVQKDTGRIRNYRTVREDNIKSGKYLFTTDHIIYSKIRPYLNKVAIPEFDGVCSADSYPLLVNKKNASKVYFSFLLRSKAFLDHVNQNSDRTNIPKVNQKQLKSFSGMCPPVHLQLEFDKIHNKLENQRSVFKKGLLELENLFNSLMQQAFKGELFKEKEEEKLKA